MWLEIILVWLNSRSFAEAVASGSYGSWSYRFFYSVEKTLFVVPGGGGRMVLGDDG
jgi:hypothetical protein